MTNIPSWPEIRQQIVDLDYKWNDPKTWAAVGLPGVSILAQKVKLAELATTINFTVDNLSDQLNELEGRINRINKFHALGAIAQTIVLIVLGRASAFFTFLAMVSAYQTYSTLSMAFDRKWSRLDDSLKIEMPKSSFY